MDMNKPVAYLHTDGSLIKVDPRVEIIDPDFIPLYTHPADLTDEEIEQIASQYLTAHAQFIGAGECHYEGEIDFARAILRKAQEK